MQDGMVIESASNGTRTYVVQFWPTNDKAYYSISRWYDDNRASTRTNLWSRISDFEEKDYEMPAWLVLA